MGTEENDNKEVTQVDVAVPAAGHDKEAHRTDAEPTPAVEVKVDPDSGPTTVAVNDGSES